MNCSCKFRRNGSSEVKIPNSMLRLMELGAYWLNIGYNWVFICPFKDWGKALFPQHSTHKVTFFSSLTFQLWIFWKANEVCIVNAANIVSVHWRTCDIKYADVKNICYFCSAVCKQSGWSAGIIGKSSLEIKVEWNFVESS